MMHLGDPMLFFVTHFGSLILKFDLVINIITVLYLDTNVRKCPRKT